MSSRFEYSEVCPTCKNAGVVGENEKPITLGFDLDTNEISCTLGHVFEALPSESALPTGTSSDAERDGATVASRDATSQNLPSNDEAKQEAASGVECQGLEAFDAGLAATSAKEDSAALAQISKQIAAPKEEVRLPSADDLDASAADETARAATVGYSSPGRAQVVADGGEARLPSGDVLFGITVPERWIEAIRAESEIQNQTASAYLQQWFTEALENFWVSNYTQSR